MNEKDQSSARIPQGIRGTERKVRVRASKLGDILRAVTRDCGNETVTRHARPALAVTDARTVGRPAKLTVKIESNVGSQSPRLVRGASDEVKCERDLLRSWFFESLRRGVSDFGAIG